MADVSYLVQGNKIDQKQTQLKFCKKQSDSDATTLQSLVTVIMVV